MSNNPDVSIVVAVYKDVEGLIVTLKSIFFQTLTNFELILVDDGNSFEVSQEIENIVSSYSKIILLKNDKNMGLTYSLIKGCNLAKAPYIARIDAGDLMIPKTRLMQQKRFLDANISIGITGGIVECVDFLNKRIFRKKKVLSQRISHSDCLGDTKTLFEHVTVMFRRSIYQEVGGYDINCRVGQDSELWPRMIRFGDGYVFSETFAVITMRDFSISVKNNDIQIINKISSLKKQVSDSLYMQIKNKVELLCEYMKLLIPIKARVYLRYKRNFPLSIKISSEISSVKDLINLYKIHEHEI